MKIYKAVHCGLCCLLIGTLEVAVMAEVFTNNVDLHGYVITNHSFVEIIDGTNSCLTDADVRSSTISIGQLCGVNPTNGILMTNDLSNLLPLAASRMVVVGDIMAGSFSGNAFGLTNLNIGAIEATNLPTSGEWDASEITVTLQDVVAELSMMTNVTLNSEVLAIVISNLQQQVDDVYATQNSITIQVTDDELRNGINLTDAYAQAKLMSPSATNRIAVIVPPARYNLSTNGLTMDTEYIDLIGLTTDHDAQYLYGEPANGGVIHQTADFVRIENLSLDDCGYAYVSQSSYAAAYAPTVSGGNTVIRNCRFTGMRVGINYAGYYENCIGGYGSFGSEGNAAGTFVNCRGADASFGGYGTASGTFINCQGGNESFGSYVEVSGLFINCRGGWLSWGASLTDAVLVNCTAADYSFGSFNMAATNFNYNADGCYFYGGPIRGSFTGDGSGLTSLNVDSLSGTINAANLPTSGVWNASDAVISNSTLKDVIAELSSMTNVTLNSEVLATVISNLQQQVDDVYVRQNSITVLAGDDETANGAALIAAYADAKAMNPSATNRIAVIVPPGRYNLSTNGLTMDTAYIDLIGQTTDRESQYLYGAPPDIEGGVIKQTVDNVCIENITIYSSTPIWYVLDGSDSAAYFPTVNGENTLLRNCRIEAVYGGLSMRAFTAAITYAGYYKDCIAGMYSFGSFYGDISGTFINCKAGALSFSGGSNATLENAVLVSCAGGANSFGFFDLAATNFNYNAAGYYLYGGPVCGDGSGLTNLNSEFLSGTISATRMPTSGVWNASGLAVSNLVLSGNSINASDITSGTISTNVLPAGTFVADVLQGTNGVLVDVVNDMINVTVETNYLYGTLLANIPPLGDISMGSYTNSP